MSKHWRNTHKTKPIQQNTKMHSKLRNTDNTNKTKTQVQSPPTTSGLGTEWDYSGRKGRDGQKKKIGKANERKKKVKRGKDEEVNGQGGRGVPRPHIGCKGNAICIISNSCKTCRTLLFKFYCSCAERLTSWQHQPITPLYWPAVTAWLHTQPCIAMSSRWRNSQNKRLRNVRGFAAWYIE